MKWPTWSLVALYGAIGQTKNSLALSPRQPPPTDRRRPTRTAADYASYWEELLLTEYREASNELKERRRTWSRRQLEDAGMIDKITDESGLKVIGKEAAEKLSQFDEKEKKAEQ